MKRDMGFLATDVIAAPAGGAGRPAWAGFGLWSPPAVVRNPPIDGR